MLDYKEIGEFAVDKANEYNQSKITYAKLVSEENELMKKIHEAEFKHRHETVEELYSNYRALLEDKRANQSFRDNFSERFFEEVLKKVEKANET